MASKQLTREFTIASGAHRDATFVLAGDAILVIGTDEFCDIRLTDAGLEPRHAMVMAQGDVVSIRRLDGDIDVDGQPVAVACPRVALEAGASIVLGSSGVRLQLAGPAESVSSAATPEAKLAPKTRRPRAVTILALSGAVVLLAGLATQKLDASRAAPAGEADAATVRALVERQGLARQVSVSETSYGVMLSGVTDRQTAARLRSAVAALHAPIINSIVSEEDLVDQVREVFRTNGYDASVTYVGEQRVRVENLDENHPRVRQAAAQVRSDVRQLHELTFADATAVQPPDRPPIYESRTADRISARVDGATAYLATTGGARYFVGSVLPGGEAVRRITPNAVQIDREGQISWFGF